MKFISEIPALKHFCKWSCLSTDTSYTQYTFQQLQTLMSFKLNLIRKLEYY